MNNNNIGVGQYLGVVIKTSESLSAVFTSLNVFFKSFFIVKQYYIYRGLLNIKQVVCKIYFHSNYGTFLSANHWHFKIKFLRNLYFGSAFMSATKFDPTDVANSLRGFVILSLCSELIIYNTTCFLT